MRNSFSFLTPRGGKTLLGATALLVSACASDPPSDKIVHVGDSSVENDAAAGAGDSGGSGSGASMTLTGGIGSTGGKAGNDSGGQDGAGAFPDLDAAVGGSGGIPSTGVQDAGVDGGSSPDGSTTNSTGNGSCFYDGTQTAFVGDGIGTCDNPLGVDLSAGNPGDANYVTLPASLLDAALPAQGTCGTATARDLVLLVWVPLGADLEVTVEGAMNADPMVATVDPPTADCASAIVSQCADRGGTSNCEYLRILAPASNDPGYRQVVVSEIIATDTPYTLRFRLQPPGGGA